MDMFVTVHRPQPANANYIIVQSPWRDYVFPWHQFMTAADIKCFIEEGDGDKLLIFKDGQLIPETEALCMQ